MLCCFKFECGLAMVKQNDIGLFINRSGSLSDVEKHTVSTYIYLFQV